MSLTFSVTSVMIVLSASRAGISKATDVRTGRLVTTKFEQLRDANIRRQCGIVDTTDYLTHLDALARPLR